MSGTPERNKDIEDDNNSETKIQNEDDTDQMNLKYFDGYDYRTRLSGSSFGSNLEYEDGGDYLKLAESSTFDESEDDILQETVTLKGLIWNFIQMFIYSADIFSDYFLAITYLIQGRYLYFGLTLAVVYIATGIDAYFNRSEYKREVNGYKYFLTLLFNIRGLTVYIEFVRMRYQLYKKINTIKETQEDFFDRNFRVANLKTHEGLFEACPQLLLQLYIMLVSIDEKLSVTLFFQNITILISLCSLAATFVTGDTARRLYEHERDNFSIWGLALQFFWIFPITASRILALSCVSSVVPILAICCFSLHCFASFLYLRLSQPYTTFGALVAAIRVFLTPYEPIEQYDTGVTYRLLRSHLLHLIGNVLAITVWAIKTDLYYKWFTVYVLILFFFISGFVFGIFSLTLLIVYKNDFFTRHDEQDSKMDRRMQPFIDWISRKISRIKIWFNTLKYKCQSLLKCKR